MLLAACLGGALMLPGPAAAYQIIWPNQTFEQPDPQQAPPAAPRRRAARPSYPKMADAPKDLVKPRGPVIIAISIDKQHLKIYDANGLFAESPVSTGVRGHATPMGVFSIIQKNKWHRSNLYSDAPMPYMQRITWSGVALHAGVVPGHPASHGCIRMPMAFATKLWAWTRLGARVIVAPGDVAPENISHPALFTHAPDASASATPVDKPADAARAKPDKAAEATSESSSAVADLRLVPKHDDVPMTAGAPAAASSERIRLANADAALAPAGPIAPPTRTDARPAEAIGSAPLPALAGDSGVNAAAPQIPADQAQTPAKDPPDAASDTKAPAVGATKDTVAKPQAPVAAAPPKRSGHIAVLISRKENRLYVRQNFEPLFDVPVTIAQNERPLGTHVFTARADSDAPGTFRWSVTSLPARKVATDDATPHRRRVAASTVEPLPPVTPAEALDRLALPEDAMMRIAAAIAPGGSIIVSDQGLGGETGLGTDFIVPLR